MCGLVGRFDTAGIPSDGASAKYTVGKMLSAIAHRGPDAQRLVMSGQTTIGFARLCIIDPDPKSQPFRVDAGRVVCAVNGAIYNFAEVRQRLEASGLGPFATESDCEVLLHLYGSTSWPGNLALLDGMYASAIWDGNKRELHLSRDFHGIKPLYYFLTAHTVYFASE
jgi:asparagine synthase (glutamine-hydrolysing)